MQTTTVLGSEHRIEGGQPVTYQLRQVGGVDSVYWYRMAYNADSQRMVTKYVGKLLPPAERQEEPAPTCRCCGLDLPKQVKGKRRAYCSAACKMKHHRQQKDLTL